MNDVINRMRNKYHSVTMSFKINPVYLYNTSSMYNLGNNKYLSLGFDYPDIDSILYSLTINTDRFLYIVMPPEDSYNSNYIIFRDEMKYYKDKYRTICPKYGSFVFLTNNVGYIWTKILGYNELNGLRISLTTLFNKDNVLLNDTIKVFDNIVNEITSFLITSGYSKKTNSKMNLSLKDKIFKKDFYSLNTLFKDKFTFSDNDKSITRYIKDTDSTIINITI